MYNGRVNFELMNIIKSALFFAIAMVMVACSNDKPAEEPTTAPTEKKEEVCTWAYNPEGKTSVKWKAFKTTKKVGVGGEFSEPKVMGGEASASVADMLSSVSFELPTASTLTGDPGRDKKIIEFFFGEMANTALITGKATSAEGDATSGKCTFAVTMNDITKDIALEYTVDGEFVTLKGTMNIEDFSPEALASLNKACEALHTGADGVSKTWPDVELLIVASMTKDCK